MAIDGREISNLDFASLIGAPLNAIVEAQAKSAIATANFIREVAFDKEGRAVLSEFRFNRIGEDGRAQEVSLSVPFITMLPIPYVTIEHAEIEFNARSPRRARARRLRTSAASSRLDRRRVVQGRQRLDQGRASVARSQGLPSARCGRCRPLHPS